MILRSLIVSSVVTCVAGCLGFMSCTMNSATSQPTLPPFVERVPGSSWSAEPAGHPRRSEPIPVKGFVHGQFYLVAELDTVPSEARDFLARSGEFRDAELVHHFWQTLGNWIYLLVHEVNGERTLINDIDDLRWKVSVQSKQDAVEFGRLIAGSLTKPFFTDAPGWELHIKRFPGDACAMSEATFAELGISPRQVEEVNGGFVLRRPLLVVDSTHGTRKLIVSFEFIGHDGLYVFGKSREVCQNDALPLIVLPDRDDLDFYFFYATGEEAREKWPND
jgi:hypothetical protein